MSCLAGTGIRSGLAGENDMTTAVPSFEVPIEQGKIQEFASATGASDDTFFGERAVIPPTFLTTARFFWQSAESKAAADHGLDQQRTLHAEQEYVFHGEPPRAGQILTATSRILERYEKQGRRGGNLIFVTTVMEFRDGAGNLVAEQRSTAVQTARAPKDESQ